MTLDIFENFKSSLASLACFLFVLTKNAVCVAVHILDQEFVVGLLVSLHYDDEDSCMLVDEVKRFKVCSSSVLTPARLVNEPHHSFRTNTNKT